MKTQTGSFLSSDGKHRIHTITWLPIAQKPVGILQIIYGMAEYAERYHDAAQFFTDQGWIVASHDHLGHGQSIRSDKELGYMGPHGAKYLIEDSYLRTLELKRQFPDLPIFVLGHSMGSIIATLFLEHYSTEIAGVILTGSVYLPKILPPLMPAIRLKAKLTGRQPDHLLNLLAFGPYNLHFERNHMFTWLSNDPSQIQKYRDDPKLGFTFTTNGFVTLFTLLMARDKYHWANQLRKDFPILITGGLDDAVGDFGREPKLLVNFLRTQGFTQVTKKEWPHVRHEPFFEKPADTQKIEAYIADWLASQL